MDLRRAVVQLRRDPRKSAFCSGERYLRHPRHLVPASATGILVFAWYAVYGQISQPGWWHFAVNLEDGTQNWFSLMVGAATTSQVVSPCNSQTFWLPMPSDGKLQVTFFNGQLPSAGGCRGSVEIHGYSPG